MKKVIEDSSIAISILQNLDRVSNEKIGILGHSYGYGGNTVLFHSALDQQRFEDIVSWFVKAM